MPTLVKRMATVLAIGVLLSMTAGCVRSKPERTRDPLPTLPSVSVAVAVTDGNKPLEGEATVPADAEGDPATEGEAPEVATPAPTEVPTAVPTATPVPYTGPWYIVMPGDILGTIAEAHGSTVSAFMSANELSTSALHAGQALRLPDGVEPLWETDVENKGIHIVRAGETLNDIAARYRMPAGQIMALNTWLKDPTLLPVGRELTVIIAPLAPGSIVHVVAAGDTLASIAGLYGVSLSDLASANYIVDANRLAVGQELVIPQ